MKWDNDAGVWQPFKVHLVLTARENGGKDVQCKTLTQVTLYYMHCAIDNDKIMDLCTIFQPRHCEL